MFARMTVLGPGLLGASLLRAAHERGLAGRTAAWSRRAQSRRQCAELGLADAVHETAREAVAGADLVVCCVPVEHIAGLVQEVRPALAEGALVTDVGSTKGAICEALGGRLTGGGAWFIGAHPMAGSEKTGMEHACADLFEGRPCFLTPAPDTPAPLLERARAFWKALGMRLTETDPARHDRLVAHVSHLPHALASALAAFLGEQEEALPAVAGTGLRDTTRIAAGDPELWVQIFRQNRPAVTEALEACARRLDGLRQALENGDEEALRAILVAGRAFRESLDTVEPQP